MNWLNLALATGLAASLVLGTTPSPSPDQTSGEVIGHVVLTSVDYDHPNAKGTHVFLMIDHPVGDAPPDGLVDRMFRLQLDEHLDRLIEEQWRSATVAWTPESVRITVGGEVTTLKTTAVDDVTTASQKLTGIGLSQFQPSQLRLPVGVLSPAEFLQLRTELAARIGSGETCVCTAGGPGALGCEIPTGGCPEPPTGCSVTCGTGFDPCCGCVEGEEGPGMACCMCVESDPG